MAHKVGFFKWFIPLGAIAVAIGIYLFVTLAAPWLVLPDEPRHKTEQRWQQVIEWSGIERLPDNPDDKPYRLLRAQGLMDELPAPLLDRVRQEPGTRLRVSQLPPKARKAILLLLDWHAHAPPLGRELCMNEVSLSAPGLLNLGRLALACAGNKPDDALRAAVLRLGHDLRQAGGFLDVAVGFTLAALAEQQAWYRGRVSPLLLSDSQPQPSEIFDSFARDSVCTLHQFEQAVQQELDIGGEENKATEQPSGAQQILHEMEQRLRGRDAAKASIKREILVYKWFFGTRLQALLPYREQPAALAEHFDFALPEDGPQSYLLRAAQPGTSEVLIEEAAAVLSAYALLEVNTADIERVGRVRRALRTWGKEHGRYPDLLQQLTGTGLGAADLVDSHGVPMELDVSTDDALLLIGERSLTLALPSAAQQVPVLAFSWIHEVEPDTFQVSRHELVALRQQESTLKQQARIVPAFDPEQRPIGFKLLQVRSGSVYDQIGLQDQDVLHSVNGRILHHPQEIDDVIASLDELDALHLRIWREDQELLLTLRLLDVEDGGVEDGTGEDRAAE